MGRRKLLGIRKNLDTSPALTLNTVAIIQARMGSTRLPGKILMEVAGRPMLLQQIRRLLRSNGINQIVVATTTDRTDDPVASLAQEAGVGCFRGSVNDVLGRFVGAAKMANADVIVRLTADSPLIDQEVTDRVIAALTDRPNQYDYACNVLNRTYPRGLDTEALFLDTLLRLDRMANSAQDREHVTTFLRSGHAELFRTCSVEDAQDNSDLRWTVDMPRDLEFVRKVYDGMNLGETLAPYGSVLKFVREHPEIVQLNSDIETWEPTTGNPS